ncbi:uncharacterized protein F4807DRAFT_435217 [Annulohypoxylon truncatum]|uniref:uncharacterized protein n=1 Tax=Annulohypoxylon truncatum TaxID=327061 RepID=UPI00200869B3|nr:uncharacterized protein F4807DRAFT_435217 [Annulohypoxylon truncatum]KAI1207300.1 hypothetical protein F4807DRAFT_435217 [Annulohypoxylon truncatum]
MSVINEITNLHASASAILECSGRTPTRSEYASALELADSALELAVAANLDGEAVAACAGFQQFCYGQLLRCCERAAGHERLVYEKRSTRASLKRKRSGRVFDTDPGEHLVNAFQAVRLGRLLDEQEREDTLETSRRIRWSDELQY